jgi:uncharacterized damage-inducible protein DinB
MTMIDALIAELEQEAVTTRRVLERVPGDRLGWKPHDKSMSLGQLALHVATLPGGIADMATRSPFQVPDFTQPAAESAEQLLPALDASLSQARSILRRMTDVDLAHTWRLLHGETEVMAMPVGALLRAIMLNHWYHHRGQLAVYLRQVGALVPSIYGPSADENPFAARPAVAAAV